MRKPATKFKPAPEGGLKVEGCRSPVEKAGSSAGKKPSTFNLQPSTLPPRFPAWLLAALLALATIALYWPATRHDFINYDDPAYVTANVHVQNGLTLENLKWAFSNPVSDNWHPVTMLSHMLDCQLFGLKPWGHHLTSLLLHAFNTALVFLLLRTMTGAVWRSLLVAALFGAHPLHVESVAWVAERKDVLSTFFWMLSLWAYAKYVEATPKPKFRIESLVLCGAGDVCVGTDEQGDAGDDAVCHAAAGLLAVATVQSPGFRVPGSQVWLWRKFRSLPWPQRRAW